MAYGLRIKDASGNILLDTSTQVGRLTGSQTIGDDPYSGTINVPGYLGTGDAVWYYVPYIGTLGDPPSAISFGSPGIFSVSGGVISWEVYQPLTIYYGLY